MTKSNFEWPNGKRLAVMITVLLETWSEGKAAPYSVQTTSLRPGFVDHSGIAWGLFPSRVWSVVSLVALPIIALAFLKRRDGGRVEQVAGSLILAGAAGNAWDRVVLCSVRDFVLLPWWPWMPNFNLADAMLSLSIGVLFVFWILHDRRPLRQARTASARQPDDGGVGDVGRDHGPRP